MAEGVRKLSEQLMALGRTVIITDPAINPANVPDGTLMVTPSTGLIKLKLTGGTTWSSLTPQQLIAYKSITTAFLADRSITNAQLAVGTVIAENIKDLEVTGVKIASNAINESKISNNAVTTIKIADNAVTSAKFASGSVTEAKIADYAITNTKLANASVSTLKIIDASITTPKITDYAVTGVKLANASISTEKLVNGAVTSDKLQDASVTNSKLEANSVTQDKIANGHILNSKMAINSVNTSNIVDLSITSAKLGTSSVTQDKIADSAISNRKIASGTISYDRLDVSAQNYINSMVHVINGTATIAGSAQVNGNLNASGDIRANRVYGAVYNDLAEAYVPGESLEPGDIVEIREDEKVYKATALSPNVVGVISDQYAQLYGGTPEEISSGAKVAVGLIGKVPIKVNGRVKLGDRILPGENGVGIVTKNGSLVVGKAIQSKTSDGAGKVLCLIYPN